MITIGLTGNSGSGKSTLCKTLKGLGAYVIDADEISRDVTKKGGDAYDEIIAFFGDSVLTEIDGEIDRKKLGDIVFSDEERRLSLVEITHKYIVAKIKDQIKNINEDPKEYTCIVVDAPLLIEAGLHEIVHKLWVVTANRDVMIARIMARDGLNHEMAASRLDRQMPLDMAQKYADKVIINNEDSSWLEKQGVMLYNELMEL